MLTNLSKTFKISILFAGLALGGQTKAGFKHFAAHTALYWKPGTALTVGASIAFAIEKITKSKTGPMERLVLGVTAIATIANLIQGLSYPREYGYRDEKERIANNNPTKIYFSLKDTITDSLPLVFLTFPFYSVTGMSSMIENIGRLQAQKDHAQKLLKEQTSQTQNEK